jgi:hypothetical protein
MIRIFAVVCCSAFLLATLLSASEAQQTCYSGRNCSGKVLSHRDQHNCRVKSRGHSWRSNAGACVNL